MGYLFPLLLISAIITCKEPPKENNDATIPQARNTTAWKNLPPVVFEASLADTLPAQTTARLGLQNISGTALKYLTGTNAYYFTYYAEKNSLLHEMSLIPFSRYGFLSDVNCRPMGTSYLSTIQPPTDSLEYAKSIAFWEADPNCYDLYECIKSPWRHTLLINKSSGQVLHRIDNLGQA